MVFVGLRALKRDPNSPGATNWKGAGVIHFNPHYVKTVNEKLMLLVLDDNSEYRIDEEGLQVFLSAMYGEDEIRGDKLREQY